MWVVQSTNRVAIIPKNPVLGLLDKERSERYAQSSNDSIKTKSRQSGQKKEIEQKNKWLGRTQRRAENPLLHGAHMLAWNTKWGTRQEVFGILLGTSHPMPPPGRQVPCLCAERHNIYKTKPSGFAGFPIGAADAPSGVLWSVQSTRLYNVSSYLRSPQEQP